MAKAKTFAPERGDLLTPDEVIDRLLAEPALRNTATCVLPAVKCGTGWRFRRSDLDAWIDGQLGRSRGLTSA